MSAYAVSVIIPCYNEEGNIAECVRRVPLMGRTTEIIVVNDGSHDKTHQVVSDLLPQYPHLRFISYGINQGKAHAVAEGIRMASGDIVMICDADMTVRPEDLPLFYDEFMRENVQLVLGTRFKHSFSRRAMPTVKVISNRMAAALFSCILSTPITDTLCGTKVMWRKDASTISFGTCRWGDYAILQEAALRKWAVKEVPVQYYERRAGESKMRLFPDGFMLYVRAIHIVGKVIGHAFRTKITS